MRAFSCLLQKQKFSKLKKYYSAHLTIHFSMLKFDLNGTATHRWPRPPSRPLFNNSRKRPLAKPGIDVLGVGESHLSTPYCPSHQRLNQKTYGKKSSPKHRWRVTVLKTAARGMPATRSTLTAMTKDPRVVEAQQANAGETPISLAGPPPRARREVNTPWRSRK